MLAVVGIKLQISGFDCVKGNVPHFRVYHVGKTELTFAKCIVHVPLKLIVAYLVALLKFPISFTVLLNGVISEMNHLI